MPERAPPRMKTERFLSVIGNLNEKNATDRRLCNGASQRQAAMKGTIRRKRRPPVVHAGLPLTPDRRRQNLSARCGTYQSRGNSGCRKHRSFKQG
ncbi:conserved hypothetical protein [Agrobacterium tomkonis CFBP 6623]|uniref:Uncharacterized protein n=1 Tax=Agrobacterium tomkonis CFBP 6623 TaxID=1183432 RepID=A0A1S7PD26_9HYPH|nr:conserved hypothetical protein [Agrobacterium tomkonis CFBP 6623]